MDGKEIKTKIKMVEFIVYAILIVCGYAIGYLRGYKHGSDRWPL
jgi:hypothetical protein